MQRAIPCRVQPFTNALLWDGNFLHQAPPKGLHQGRRSSTWLPTPPPACCSGPASHVCSDLQSAVDYRLQLPLETLTLTSRWSSAIRSITDSQLPLAYGPPGPAWGCKCSATLSQCQKHPQTVIWGTMDIERGLLSLCYGSKRTFRNSKWGNGRSLTS